MAGKIICMFACLLCALPFFLLGYLGKIKNDPLPFWAGDEKRLSLLISDVKSYNIEMSQNFREYGIGFLISGGLFLCYPVLGITALLYDLTFGLYLLWKRYKKALEKYS